MADERIAKRPRRMSRFKSNAEGVRETDASGSRFGCRDLRLANERGTTRGSGLTRSRVGGITSAHEPRTSRRRPLFRIPFCGFARPEKENLQSADRAPAAGWQSGRCTFMHDALGLDRGPRRCMECIKGSPVEACREIEQAQQIKSRREVEAKIGR